MFFYTIKEFFLKIPLEYRVLCRDRLREPLLKKCRLYTHVKENRIMCGNTIFCVSVMRIERKREMKIMINNETQIAIKIYGHSFPVGREERVDGE